MLCSKFATFSCRVSQLYISLRVSEEEGLEHFNFSGEWNEIYPTITDDYQPKKKCPFKKNNNIQSQDRLQQRLRELWVE